MPTPTQICLKRSVQIQFEQAIREWTLTLKGIKIDDNSLRGTSINGKTLRGSLQKHQRAVHLLSALDHQTGYVLSQSRMDAKTNEAKAIFELFKTLVLKGESGYWRCDVLSTRYLPGDRIDSNGDYFFVVQRESTDIAQKHSTCLRRNRRLFPPTNNVKWKQSVKNFQHLEKGMDALNVGR